MAGESWIPLTDYSNKYKVSLSTLRRRIKAQQVEFQYEQGKYLLRDAPLSLHALVAASNPSMEEEAIPKQYWNRVTNSPPHTEPGHSADPSPSGSPASSESILNGLVAEVKKAYALVLQEKEEMIIMLKEEVTDLRTLVRVLESENERIKSNAREASPIDAWLSEIDS